MLVRGGRRDHTGPEPRRQWSIGVLKRHELIGMGCRPALDQPSGRLSADAVGAVGVRRQAGAASWACDGSREKQARRTMSRRFWQCCRRRSGEVRRRSDGVGHDSALHDQRAPSPTHAPKRSADGSGSSPGASCRPLGGRASRSAACGRSAAASESLDTTTRGSARRPAGVRGGGRDTHHPVARPRSRRDRSRTACARQCEADAWSRAHFQSRRRRTRAPAVTRPCVW